MTLGGDAKAPPDRRLVSASFSNLVGLNSISLVQNFEKRWHVRIACFRYSYCMQKYCPPAAGTGQNCPKTPEYLPYGSPISKQRCQVQISCFKLVLDGGENDCCWLYSALRAILFSSTVISAWCRAHIKTTVSPAHSSSSCWSWWVVRIASWNN